MLSVHTVRQVYMAKFLQISLTHAPALSATEQDSEQDPLKTWRAPPEIRTP